jgi:hypothetical protein
VDRGGDRPPRSPALFDSERLVPLSSVFVLVKQMFEFAPVGFHHVRSSGSIDHSLDGNYVIVIHRAAAVLKARGPVLGCKPSGPNFLVSFARTSL